MLIFFVSEQAARQKYFLLHRIITGLSVKTQPRTFKIIEQSQYIHGFGLDVTVNKHSAGDRLGSMISFTCTY